MLKNNIQKAAELILTSNHVTAFTGAGISVESGIPPFRGPNGLWSKYDPIFLDITYFRHHPAESWKLIKEIFYDFFGQAKPNKAHKVLANMEKNSLLNAIITQNIDNLHQEAGSQNVYEFHGTSRILKCNKCGAKFEVTSNLINNLPPKCSKCDNGILRPDFVFFGEPIPEPANSLSFREAEISDLFIIIGSTGEIMPASIIPFIAKEKGVKIIEINIEQTQYTRIADIFLQGKATEVMELLESELKI